MSIALDIFGDRWTLLIVRDMMVRGYRTFREFQAAGEGIASNILAARLRRLKAVGIVCTEPHKDDARSQAYRLTEKGIALAPLILEMLIWSGRHEETAAPAEFIRQMESNRQGVLAETYRRWREHDHTPLIPPFMKRAAGQAAMGKGKQTIIDPALRCETVLPHPFRKEREKDGARGLDLSGRSNRAEARKAKGRTSR